MRRHCTRSSAGGGECTCIYSMRRDWGGHDGVVNRPGSTTRTVWVTQSD